MKNVPYCCNQECEQGDLCPLRNPRADPPTPREWALCLILLALGLTLSAIPFFKQQ